MVRTSFGLETYSKDTSLNIKALMTGTYKSLFHHSIRTILCRAISVHYMEWAAAIELGCVLLHQKRGRGGIQTAIWCGSVNND
jgi:hypothetical protein